MNPTLRFLFLAALLAACGRSQFLPGPPADAGSVESPADSIVEVSVGGEGHCTRTRLGRVECDGPEWDPALFHFTLADAGARAISAGGNGVWTASASACALLEAGRIACARSGDEGAPLRNELSIEGAQAIAVGVSRGCALTEAGEVLCSNQPHFQGSLRVVGGMQGAVAISCGYRSCCALMGDGGVRCLNEGSTGDSVVVALPAPSVAVAAGFFHTCSLDAHGQSYCWGDEADAATPTGSARAISAGSGVTCALDAAGFVQCFSANGTSSPFDVPVVQMDVADREVCGVEAAGTLHCLEF